MNVVVRRDGREYEVSLEPGGPAAVAELRAALGGGPAESLRLDGVEVSPDVPIAELDLRDGSVVDIGNGGTAGHVAGLGMFNRPPRLSEPIPQGQITPPSRPVETGAPMRFGWAALVVPVLLGLTMAVLIHPRMAAFALFSPAMLLANWLEDHRRLRRRQRESDDTHSRQMQKFRAQLSRARQQEKERRLRADRLPGQLISRLKTTDTRLWERRPRHSDFMQVPIGTGCASWDVPIGDADPGVGQVVDEYRNVHDVPIRVDLGPGAVVGIAGHRSLILAMARQLILQTTVNHGPADLALSVLSEQARDWDWAKWLPHVLADTTGKRRLAATPREIDEVAGLVTNHQPGQAPHQLLVLDLPDMATGRYPEVRAAIQSGDIACIALATHPAALPSAATTVVSADQEESYIRHANGSRHSFTQWTISLSQMRQGARLLARLDDPEAAVAGGVLPARVELVSLLGLEGDPVASVRSRWRSPAAPAAVVGVAEGEPFAIDLVADGPHALFGGTTGAGKSELLRSLVAGLAIAVSPEALNLVLVDYKGGSAFDVCADLPHTVGVVTDLDEHLAARALICLEAELQYREQRLRDHGASDITALEPGVAMPRLLVIVDEFAALAAELPQFMNALVGVAQRGRSLGVHLLLATQRPSGVIDENIKANTNLRIALRMQDTADSIDVIGGPSAATIPRSLPGRALARRGPSDVIAFQAALVSGHKLGRDRDAISVRPFVFAHQQPPAVTRSVGARGGPTDLERIVAACRRVADEMALAPPRSPWPDPLPHRVVRSDLADAERDAVFAVADEPDRQRTVPVACDPGAGNLLLYGLPGSGTTTALGAIAVGLAAAHEPDRLHIHVLDFDDQQLMPLRELPHVGSVIAGGDRERQVRLLRVLAAELERRRTERSEGTRLGIERPIIITMIDNYGGFSDAHAEPGHLGAHDLVARLVADGPGLGMLTYITAKQPADVPNRIAASIAGRLIFRLADRYDYTGLGVPAVDPPRQPGRAFQAGSGRELQVALPHGDGLRAAVAEIPYRRVEPPPWTIAVLPREVALDDFAGAGAIGDDEWFLPLGLGDSTLRPAGLLLRQGEHALITGPPRAGKTTALLTAARVARQAAPSLRIGAIAPRTSALCSAGEVNDVLNMEELDGIGEQRSGLLLLIDDAELVDEGEPLRRLLARRQSWLRVIATGSADVIRGLYGHWTQDLRRSRIGCALQPDSVSDGDLWHTQLPRHRHQSFPAGRGYLLAAGRSELIQLGRP